MDVERLIRELARDEAVKLKPYRDTVGKLTIGIGRNLDDVGISVSEAYDLCRHDVDRTLRDLDRALPWWRQLDEVRQRVIVNMGFNMGVGDPQDPRHGLVSFKTTLALVQAGKYEDAATLMLESLWARQVGPRASRLAKMMRDGNEPA